MRSILLLCFSLFTTSFVWAQDQFAFAITDLTKDGASWNAVRKLDLKTGNYSPVLFNGTDEKVAVFDARSKKQFEQVTDARWGKALHAPFSTGVAATAYDKKNNRLYFTPMYIDQLRYIDLKTMKVFYVQDQPFSKLGNMHNSEAKIMTRMVVAPDGFGYAVTNDGKALVRFSTGKKMLIEQLGSLIDDPSNTISVHKKTVSYGGDMISDDEGNLFIISSRNHVFRVSLDTRIAKYLGQIKGLPDRFTVNGAVVAGDGALLVSSAVDGSSYYVVDPSDWSAQPYAVAPMVYRSSDLANSNYLSSKKTKTIETIARNVWTAHQVQVFPNPVITDKFTVQFSSIPPGEYTIELSDIMGRTIQQRRVNVQSARQNQEIPVAATTAKGVYLVKVMDRNNKSMFEQKVMVQ